MIQSFRNKALAELWSTGTSAKIDSGRISASSGGLTSLPRRTAGGHEYPGFDFHALRSFVPTRYTIHINGPWCITFKFDGENALQLDFEQYY